MSSLNLVAEIPIYICVCVYIYMTIYAVSYPDIFSYHSYPISIATQLLSPNIYRTGLSKDLRPGWKVHFKPVQILNIVKNLLTAPKNIVGTLQFHRVDICTGLKKNSTTLTYYIYIYYIYYIYVHTLCIYISTTTALI